MIFCTARRGASTRIEKNSVADCKALVDDAYYFLDPVVQAWESIFVFPCFNFLLSKTLSTFILLNNHTSIVFSFPKISSFIVQHWQLFRRCHTELFISGIVLAYLCFSLRCPFLKRRPIISLFLHSNWTGYLYIFTSIICSFL